RVGRGRRRNVLAADAIRRRRAQPAHVPDGDGPPGGASRAAVRAGAARTERRAAPAGAPRHAAARRAGGRAVIAPLLARPARVGAVMTDLRSKIREVPDFPTPGVGFKDITPLLADRDALRETVEQLAAWVDERQCDLVVGAE